MLTEELEDVNATTPTPDSSPSRLKFRLDLEEDAS